MPEAANRKKSGRINQHEVEAMHQEYPANHRQSADQPCTCDLPFELQIGDYGKPEDNDETLRGQHERRARGRS